jgi:hypothetical protein
MKDFQLKNQLPVIKFSQSKLKQARSNDRPTQDNTDDFLTKLQIQAKMQARLEKTRILPHQVDSLASFVGRYSWQSLLIASLITTILLEVVF